MSATVDENLLRTARGLWEADDHDRALDAFRKLTRQHPDDLRLAVEAASYLGMRFEVAEAIPLLEKCERQLAGNPIALFQTGLAYERAFRPEAALRCFKTAIHSKPHLAPLLKIAEWHERRGQLNEAHAALDRCPMATPRVKLWRARLHRRSDHHSEAKSLLGEITTSPDADVLVKIDAWYELAELHDRNDDVLAAINAATTAKDLQKPLVAPQLQRAKALAPVEANFVSTANRAYFERWQGKPDGPTDERRIALLTGPPRSGTSLMARILGMHEQLIVADEIEAYPTYLQPRLLQGQSGTSAADVLDGLSAEHLDECRELYWKWIASATGRSPKFLLDKFPSTTFLIQPFRRLFPHAVIVMAIRDPRDIVVSCYLQNLALNPVSAMFSKLEWTVMRCAAELEAWLQLRDELPQPWHEARYEDVAHGDHAGLGDVLNAMKLEWSDEFVNFQPTLATNPVRSPTYAQLREPINSKRAGRWELYREFLQPHLGQLTDLAGRLGYK